MRRLTNRRFSLITAATFAFFCLAIFINNGSATYAVDLQHFDGSDKHALNLNETDTRFNNIIPEDYVLFEREDRRLQSVGSTSSSSTDNSTSANCTSTNSTDNSTTDCSTVNDTPIAIYPENLIFTKASIRSGGSALFIIGNKLEILTHFRYILHVFRNLAYHSKFHKSLRRHHQEAWNFKFRNFKCNYPCNVKFSS